MKYTNKTFSAPVSNGKLTEEQYNAAVGKVKDTLQTNKDGQLTETDWNLTYLTLLNFLN